MLFVCFSDTKIGSCTTSLSGIFNIEIWNLYIYIYMLYFFIFSKHWVHFYLFLVTHGAQAFFGPTDFKNSCIVACEYWYFYTCGSSGGVNFRNTHTKKKCVAGFLINELSHRLDLISEFKSIRTKWRTRLNLIWTWGGSSVFHYQVFLHNPLCVKNMFCTKIQWGLMRFRTASRNTPVRQTCTVLYHHNSPSAAVQMCFQLSKSRYNKSLL